MAHELDFATEAVAPETSVLISSVVSAFRPIRVRRARTWACLDGDLNTSGSGDLVTDNTVSIAVPNNLPVVQIYPAGTECTINHANAGGCYCVNDDSDLTDCVNYLGRACVPDNLFGVSF